MPKEKFLVAKLTEREKLIAKTKANLYSVSLDELVKAAINEYYGKVHSMDCPHCHEKTVVSRKKPKECVVEIRGKETVFLIDNYPINLCDVCGGEFDDMETSVNLVELIRFEILEHLRTNKPLPGRFDFEDLLKM